MTGWRADDHDEEPVFGPEHLLAEARRQRGMVERPVPAVCVLDPDGDLVTHVRRHHRARRSRAWACYHTEMFEFTRPGGGKTGIVGSALGAPFAVLVAEQLFASGCRLLVSIASAARIEALDDDPPYAILIDRALCDEGTSARYLPGSADGFVPMPDPALLRRVESVARAALGPAEPLYVGATWSTDAPYRETESAIAAARGLGALAVEMEASALYAFATARGHPVVCFAMISDEKGEASGAEFALHLVEAAAQAASMKDEPS